MHHDNSSADTEQANKQSFDAVEECNQAHWNHVVNRKASYGTEFTSVGPGNTVLGTVVQGLEKFFVHYPRSNYPVQKCLCLLPKHKLRECPCCCNVQRACNDGYVVGWRAFHFVKVPRSFYDSRWGEKDKSQIIMENNIMSYPVI